MCLHKQQNVISPETPMLSTFTTPEALLITFHPLSYEYLTHTVK